MAIGGELHSDEEALLLEDGSAQADIWGINRYPAKAGDSWIEFDSMFNVRPSQGNRSRRVEDVDRTDSSRRSIARSSCLISPRQILGGRSTCETARKVFPRNAWAGFIEGAELLCAAYDDGPLWEERLAEFESFASPTLPTMTIGRAMYICMLARTYHVRGRQAELAAYYPVLSELAGRGFRCVGTDMVDSIAGLAATAAENWAVAEHHFERGIAHAERIQHRFALPGSREWYAEMLMVRSAPGDDGRASALLRQAIDEYRSMGMTLMLERADHRFARSTVNRLDM